ncbi:MAG: recombinase family protein [Clostridia bacterium]|nr:recombinase family protein [Clostridia bacterium]
MKEENEIICGLYPRVSTEDQSRFGHSLDEQEDRLRKLCEFKGYKIYKVYREEGVSAKNTNRPKFQEMVTDMKDGKINKIIVYKLDRLTRSIKDLETICTLLEEYHCDLESVAEEINTGNANGKFFIRMLTILAQLEIERTSERTKFGLVGAAKKGHISGKPALGYTKKDKSKKLVIDDLEAEVVKRIFSMYLEGSSVCYICEKFNEEEVLNRHWATTTVDKILSNKIYIGNIEHGKKSKKNAQIFENVVPTIIDKTTFDMVQKRKEKNLKNFKRKRTYIFMQKILCPKCHKIMGGESSTSGTGDKHIYYKCNCCKKRISEKRIEKELLKFLNDMLDFFLIIDNSFKPSMCRDIELEISKYEKMKEEQNDKITRIKKEFMDGEIAAKFFEKELHYLEKEIKNIELKIVELKDLKQNNEHKQDALLFFNVKEIEKLKLKSEYVKEHNLWNQLSQEQKQYIINKYIDEIEINSDNNRNVSILNIIFNKNEIENIGYMFRNGCFDMIVDACDRDIILSNAKSEEETKSYVSTLRNFYNIKETTIQAELLDINSFNMDDIIQIIPQEKSSKFEKNKFTILQIEI